MQFSVCSSTRILGRQLPEHRIFNFYDFRPVDFLIFFTFDRVYFSHSTYYDIGTEILNFQCLNCFKTPLFCKSIIPEDSKISRRDLSFASVKSRFKAILKKSEFFDLVWNLPNFRLQYFSCLPLKISSSEFHSILKMISASRRIFFEKLPNFRI